MGSVCHEATLFGKERGEVHGRMPNTGILKERALDKTSKAGLAKAKHCKYLDSDQGLTGKFYMICCGLFCVGGNLSPAPASAFIVAFLVVLCRARKTPAIFLEASSKTCIRILFIASLK